MAAHALIVVFVGLYFLPVLRGGVYAFEDIADQWMPFAEAAARTVCRGQMPWWSDEQFGGFPLYADSQAQIFYPPALIRCALPAARAVTWLIVTHVWIATAGMFVYARSLGLRRVAAFAAAVAYGCAPYFAAHLRHLYVVTGAWLPWAAAAGERFLAAREAAALSGGRGPMTGSGFLAAGAAASAMTLLAGHLQVAYYALGTVLLLTGARGFIGGGRAALGRTLVAALTPPLVGVLLAAPLLLPGAELAREGLRGVGGMARDAASQGLEIENQIAVLFPFAFGDVGGGRFWGPGVPWEMSGSLVLPLLAVSGLALAAPYARRRALVLVALGGLAFLAAMGDATPLHGVLWDVLPGYKMFRIPARLLLVVTFAAAALAAFALDAMARLPAWWPTGAGAEARARAVVLLPAAVLAVVAALGAGYALGRAPAESLPLARASLLVGAVTFLLALGAAALALAGRGNRGWLAAGVALLGALFVHHAGAGINQTMPLAQAEPPTPPMVSALTTQLARRPGARFASPHEPFWLMSVGLRYGLDTMNGYNPLRLRRVWDMMLAIETGQIADAHDGTGATRVIHNVDSPMLDALGIGYYVTAAKVDAQHFREIPPPAHGWDAPGLHLYENLRPMPRAWVVYHTITAETPAAATLAWKRLEPSRNAIVAEPVRTDWPLAETFTPARLVDRTGARWTWDVDATGDGHLVFAEPWYPGWRVSVDGKERSVVLTDVALQGVPVARGRHRVVFWYTPTRMRLALALALAGLLLTAALAMAGRVGRRPRGPEGSPAA